jgi:hypothetical protein
VKFKLEVGPRRVAAPPRPSTSSAAPTSSAPVTTAARTLALAHFIEREVRAGRWKSYREAAVALGVCHARVQHVVGLLLLPAGVQMRILTGELEPAERAMREAAALAAWMA